MNFKKISRYVPGFFIQQFYQQTCFWSHRKNFRVPLMFWSQDGSIQIRLLRRLVRMWTFVFGVELDCFVSWFWNPTPSAVFGSRRQTTWRALAQSWLIMSACLHGFTMFVEWGWLMPIEKIQRFITTGPLLWPQQLMAVNQWCTTHGTCFIKWCFHLKDFHVSVLTLPMLGWLCVLKARPQRQRHFTLRRSRPRGCRCVSSSACAVTCCCYQNL